MRIHLDSQRRIEQIRGGQSLVNPARGGTDPRRDVLEKGDHVVIRALLDLADVFDIERRFLRMVAASSLGIVPRSAIASHARTSISSQISSLRCSLQSERI